MSKLSNAGLSPILSTKFSPKTIEQKQLTRRRSTSEYLNNPKSILPYQIPQWDTSVSTSALTRNLQTLNTVKDVVLAVCPEMKNLKVEDINIKQLGGGLTNVLYLVEGMENSDGEDSDAANGNTFNCLVRVNGSSDSDILVDREVENRVSAYLSEVGEAPRYFGRFGNGRVEEFYEGAMPLGPRDLGAGREQLGERGEGRSYAWYVAGAMGRLHRLRVGEGVCKTELGTGQVWGQTDEWVGIVERGFDEGYGRDVEGKVGCSWEGIKKEWEEIKKKLMREGGEYGREVTFTHMDCQSLNILRAPTWKEWDIKLIDFEYSGHNPRALDIGNTFCEHCSANDLKADWENEYPSDEQKDFYLRRYASVASPERVKTEVDNGTMDEFIKELAVEADRHSLISHLGWVVWSLIQKKVSCIEFDYLEYARGRMEGYWWMKKQLVEKGMW